MAVTYFEIPWIYAVTIAVTVAFYISFYMSYVHTYIEIIANPQIFAETFHPLKVDIGILPMHYVCSIYF